MKNIRTKTVICLAALLPMMLVSCSKSKKTDTTKQNEIEKVQIESAKSEEIDQIYDFTSTIEADVKNYISSAGGTRIEKIYVEVGSHVKKGQVLVRMENTSLATSNAQLDNIKTELNRIQALYKSGGASKQQVDQIKVQYDVAKRNISNLKQNITLTSPISGVITQKNFDNGDVAGAQPILQVMQISPVKLRFNINESFYNKIKIGMGVTAKVEVFGDEEFNGKISLISPTIDPSTRTFYVEAKFSNGNQKLRPGMFGRVQLNLGKANKILVSDKSIVKQSGTNDKYVYIEKDGKVEYRQVQLGRRINDRYEILSGINDGENVVISSTTRLKNGSKVIVVK
jgi:RND family efflux transporter MFP subunit